MHLNVFWSICTKKNERLFMQKCRRDTDTKTSSSYLLHFTNRVFSGKSCLGSSLVNKIKLTFEKNINYLIDKECRGKESCGN